MNRTLGPIFLDRSELSAAPDLSETIHSALSASEALIVLTSPAAKASHWVSEEIATFRKMHPEAPIFCAGLSGTPQNSFPDILLEGGSEPLAADLSGRNDRLGVTQLAAGLLNVGLNDLIQRDLKKARRRVTAITVGGSALILTLGALTLSALSARALADQRTQDAEGQIEFMITDLKDELEAVGRLEPLNTVGQRAESYYAAYPLSRHDADALGRRSRVFHMLGEVQALQGNSETATSYFRKAFDASKALLARHPDDPDRIFDHAQSAFWVGSSHFNRGEHSSAKRYFETYGEIVERLAAREGMTKRVSQERIYVLTNLGAVALATGDRDGNVTYQEDIVTAKTALLAQDSADVGRRISAAKSHIELARAYGEAGGFESAVTAAKTALDVLEASAQTQDFRIGLQKLITQRSRVFALSRADKLVEARAALTSAFELSETLLAMEPENITLQYNRLQLELSAFQLAYLEGDTDQARSVAERLANDPLLAAQSPLPASRRAVFERAQASFPLYLGAMDSEANHQAMARDYLKSRTSQNDALAPRLLAHLLLEETFELTQFCTDDIARMRVSERAALAKVLSEESCPDAAIKHPPPKTLFHVALDHLNLDPSLSQETDNAKN